MLMAAALHHRAGAGWRFFDLLPGAAGKGAAMHHVRSSLGFDEADTVAAGDSVNDLLMLQQVRAPSLTAAAGRHAAAASSR